MLVPESKLSCRSLGMLISSRKSKKISRKLLVISTVKWGNGLSIHTPCSTPKLQIWWLRKNGKSMKGQRNSWRKIRWLKNLVQSTSSRQKLKLMHLVAKVLNNLLKINQDTDYRKLSLSMQQIIRLEKFLAISISTIGHRPMLDDPITIVIARMANLTNLFKRADLQMVVVLSMSKINSRQSSQKKESKRKISWLMSVCMPSRCSRKI